MNPKLIDEMGWRMAEVYAAVTDRLLVNLARHFKFIAEGAKPGGAWDYMVKKLAEMGQVTRESEAIILETLKDADAALQVSLEEAIKDGLKGVDKPLKEAANKGLLMGEGFIPPEIAPRQMQTFQAYYRQSADKLNLVNTVMLESTEQAYQTTVSDIANRINAIQGVLNTETGEVITGVSSINKAVKDGVSRMVDIGITGFIDHGGHHWSPEAYVEMDIRTTMANTARAAVWEQAEQYGVDLYQVSHHDGARPLCYPWQGKVISRNEWTGEVEDFEGNKVHVYAQSETSYGEPAGLFGINCGHYPIPFIPGFSRIRPPEQNEEQNAKEYEESQKQRALERKLREEKRDLAVLKAQGASDEEITAQRLKVKNARTNLDDFCEETGRARRSGRETTPIKASWPGENEPLKTKRETSWPEGDGGIPADRIKTISKYAKDNGVNIDINSFKYFEGSEQTVRDVIDSVAQVNKDFPMLSDPKKGLIVSNARLDDNEYAHVRGRTLYINNNAFRNRKALEADYNDGVQKGIFPAGTTFKGIGNHEAGHLVRSLYKLPTRELTDGVDLSAISRYAAENRSEGIAEAFNSYYGSARSPEALTIIEKCRKIIADRGEKQ